jgi:TolA-binding protein
MKTYSQSKFVLFVTLASLISVAALAFVFVQRGAAQDKEQQNNQVRPIQRPIVTNTVQEKQAAQIRELMADVAELKNQISEMRQPLNQLKACCEKQVSKADFDKQIFETKLRLTTLEKDFKGHTHENLKLGVSGNNVIVLDPNKVEKLKFPLSGPIQH